MTITLYDATGNPLAETAEVHAGAHELMTSLAALVKHDAMASAQAWLDKQVAAAGGLKTDAITMQKHLLDIGQMQAQAMVIGYMRAAYCTLAMIAGETMQHSEMVTLEEMGKLIDRIVESPEPGGNLTLTRKCRSCGCTDNDCRGCIERTGEPCRWIEDDLCSACVETEVDHACLG